MKTRPTQRLPKITTTPSGDSDPSKKGSDDNDGLAVGLIVAAVVLLIAILALVYVKQSKKDRSRKAILDRKLKEARKSLLELNEESSDYAAHVRKVDVGEMGESSEYAVVPRSMQLSGIGSALNATATEDYLTRQSALAGGTPSSSKIGLSGGTSTSTSTDYLHSPGLGLDGSGTSIRVISVRRENPAFKIDGQGEPTTI